MKIFEKSVGNKQYLVKKIQQFNLVVAGENPDDELDYVEIFGEERKDEDIKCSIRITLNKMTFVGDILTDDVLRFIAGK